MATAAKKDAKTGRNKAGDGKPQPLSAFEAWGLDATPNKDAIATELLVFWDADTWLTLMQLRQRFDQGWTLDDAGIRAIEAEACVNKYNSIIVRTASHPTLVSPSEAASWVKKKMSWIADEIYRRASA